MCSWVQHYKGRLGNRRALRNEDTDKMHTGQALNFNFNLFESSAEGPKFTWGSVERNTIQFLDIKLIFKNDHLCWMYNPRSKKGLLPFDSAI
uniref:Tick transposon n=1 Tax=Rhipicephalus appendiculatus TaxID=34631 RepID=A0A131Z079_RHIAP